MSESLLDISKALKCQVCGKYIRDYKELHKYNTCSVNCYNHVYYLKFTKEKRKNKKIKDILDGILIIGRSNGKTLTEQKIILNKYISKDKIREKVKELEKTREMLTDSNGMLEISASIDILKELLEGE